jgi:aspartate/methionine/tyrosine aminotransferase
VKPRFSQRTGWNLEPTRFARALAALRASAAPVFDLSASNPTACELEYDAAGILRELSRPESMRYEPDPHGMLVARQAVADYYAKRAAGAIDPERIFLTASTSEAYGYIFRLHCDPGDEVLVAEPSYPLLEFLGKIEDVNPVSYPLFYDDGWRLDTAALESRISPRTRAVVVVHPNNPTGHFTAAIERRELERICEHHGLVLIVDEVFLDYGLDDRSTDCSEHEAPARAKPPMTFAAGPHPVSTYILSGLSKLAGLPQMKAAWILALGPDGSVEQASARLEVIADTFLSVNTPVQHALPFLLAGGRSIQQQVRSRVRQNLAELDRQLRGAPALSRLKVQAGWYAVLRVPALRSGEELAVRLLEECRVIVHPGYFYGFEGDGWLVVSLLPESLIFTEGIGRLIESLREPPSSDMS